MWGVVSEGRQKSRIPKPPNVGRSCPYAWRELSYSSRHWEGGVQSWLGPAHLGSGNSVHSISQGKDGSWPAGFKGSNGVKL